MKQITLLFFFSLSVLISRAQIQAVTTTGEEVILYENKTWAYANDSKSEAVEVPVNKKKFEKPDKATFLAKSSVLKVGFYLNPKVWIFKKSKEGDASEFEFELRQKDAYGMAITERTEIPIETLKEVALSNAREVSPDIKAVKEEYREVNGKRIFCMQMNGTVKGMKISYLGYYYSSEEGTLQFLTYTAQNLLDDYGVEMEELLNGLVIF
jgi:hypothetical protein